MGWKDMEWKEVFKVSAVYAVVGYAFVTLMHSFGLTDMTQTIQSTAIHTIFPLVAGVSLNKSKWGSLIGATVTLFLMFLFSFLSDIFGLPFF